MNVIITVMDAIINETLTLPVIPLREGILFPGVETPLSFSRPLSVNAANLAVRSNQLAVIVSQKNGELENPNVADLYQIGVLVKIDKIFPLENGANCSVQALSRVKIGNYLQKSPALVAQVEVLQDIVKNDEAVEMLTIRLQSAFKELVQAGKAIELTSFLQLFNGASCGQIADHIANTLNADTKIKQPILEAIALDERLELILEQIEVEKKVISIERDVIKKTQDKFDKTMRDNILRERLRMIQKELGDDEDETQVADEFTKKLNKLKLSEANHKKVAKEIKRFRSLPEYSPENGYLRTWLDTVFELPWNKLSHDQLNIKSATAILDKSHYGLKEVKDRVLEAIAVLAMKKRDQQETNLPTILCFVGPPGVGKTSIGRSIAEALGRKFTKIALGGVHDEAEIRGHRRTYVGAMPGRIIAGLKQAGTNNPVFMLDEIDKLGNDYHGDPTSALLEVLDPAQNSNFEDHYLDMPYDLSKVIFITTANSLDIPAALRDRLEVISYSGYTTHEKIQIAKNHLFEKNLKQGGLKKSQLAISDSTYQTIIESYTREAGVRELERLLSKIMRKVARELLEHPKTKQVRLSTKKLADYLGPRIYDPTLKNKTDEVGVATGLAWTSVGGDVLFIETTLTPGKGELKLTGKLGDVMKESAQAALTYVKSQTKKLKIKTDVFEKYDLHVHVPEGAVPKDGPSAGVTMATAIASACTGRGVRKDIAMTGEVTLRGQVLRIGGLKEKAIAAHRSGCKTILIPAENERDLVDIPEEVKADITFVPVKNVSEVLKRALI